MKKLKDVDYYVDKLGCSISEALELMEFDKNVDDVMKQERAQEREDKKVAATTQNEKPKGIQDNELEMMLADIVAGGKTEFANKDLKIYLGKWNLTARQTPSRLKKLVELGKLIDLGGTPKTYKIGD